LRGTDEDYSTINSPLLINVRREGVPMKEINSLIERTKRYLKNAEILLEEGDYESTFCQNWHSDVIGIPSPKIVR